MTTRKPRVLIVAYQFPPVGGAGVQRVAKFTKYLPEHGWDVSVLTVSNPSVPVVDQSLRDEIPAETVIRTARTFEPGYGMKQSLAEASPSPAAWRKWLQYGKRSVRGLATAALQPDPQMLWAPQAIRAGRKLLREYPHDVILVSGPPFSSFLVGAALRRLSGLPLVLDYRDEWSISNRYWENKSRHPLVQAVQRRLQRWVIGQADMLLATTEASARTLAREAAEIGRDIPVRCLYNGFDAADLPGGDQPRENRERGKFRLSHVGTLWQLTTATPLVRAIQRLAERDPRLAAGLEVEIVGRSTTAEESQVQQLADSPVRLLRREYVDHSAAVQVMRDSDDLCLLLADLPGAERVVPGKTFEYLATGRSILAITPEGDLARLLRGFAGVSVFAPSDIAGICEYLAGRLTAPKMATTYVRDVARFERQHQTGELAGLLRRVAQGTEFATVSSSVDLLSSTECLAALRPHPACPDGRADWRANAGPVRTNAPPTIA